MRRGEEQCRHEAERTFVCWWYPGLRTGSVYLPWRTAPSEIISKHVKHIYKLNIFMGHWLVGIKRQGQEINRGRQTTDWHVLITVSDLFLFMVENHWCIPPGPSDVMQRGQSLHCIFIKLCMQSQKTRWWMITCSAPRLLGQTGGLIIKTMQKIHTSVQMKEGIVL